MVTESGIFGYRQYIRLGLDLNLGPHKLVNCGSAVERANGGGVASSFQAEIKQQIIFKFVTST